MPLGNCHLCRKDKELQDSHFVGRAVYKRLREPSLPNPRPIMFTSEQGKQTGTQITDYVFCYDCEQIFNKRGENFIHPHIATTQSFPLLDLFVGRTPLLAEEGYRVFDGTKIPKLDCAAILHFGAGIFYKAAAYVWQFEDSICHIDIGEYAEPLRKFVLDDSPLPPDIAISVGISSRLPKFLGFIPPVQMAEPHGVIYKFYVSGLIYTLMLGNDIPERLRNSAFSSTNLVYLMDEVSDVGRDIMKLNVANAKLSPELTKLLKEGRLKPSSPKAPE